MKKIMIYAYTKFNLGDDLFIKILIDRYPNTKFILYAPTRYKNIFEESKNLKVIPNDTFFVRGCNYVLKNIRHNFLRDFIAKRCDGVVYIGGSLFIQRDNWKKSFENKKSMRVKNKPFYLLGANFGPYKDNDFYFKYKEIFREYTDICFREKYSYDLFKDLNNTRIAADIVFQLNQTRIKSKTNNIVISVIKPSIRQDLKNYDEIYYNKIKDITTCFIDNGYKVTLMSFCQGEGDEEATKEVKDLIPKEYLKSVSSYFYKTNINEALKIVEESCFVVATRFHSMILGWLYNKPVYPIVYSRKMTNVMNDIGFNGYSVSFSNLSDLQTDEVLQSIETNKIDISSQISNSEKHFYKLDDFLSR